MECKEKKWKKVYFKGEEKVFKKVDEKAGEGTLTTARIAAKIEAAKNKKDCHAETADNPEFLKDRYRYGAEHAITALLRGYYNKTKTCGSSVFYGEGKNTIRQYRIYTYINAVYDLSKDVKRQEKWQKISGADKEKEEE